MPKPVTIHLPDSITSIEVGCAYADADATLVSGAYIAILTDKMRGPDHAISHTRITAVEVPSATLPALISALQASFQDGADYTPVETDRRKMAKIEAENNTLRLALAPFARLKVPFIRTYNAGAYSLLFADIERANAALPLAGAESSPPPPPTVSKGDGA